MLRTQMQMAAALMVCLGAIATGCHATPKTKQASVLPHGSSLEANALSSTKEAVGRSIPPPVSTASATRQEKPAFVSTTPIDAEATNSLRSGTSVTTGAATSIENRLRLSQNYSGTSGTCNDACCRR